MGYEIIFKFSRYAVAVGLSLVWLMLQFQQVSLAEMYKYKDELGRWQFTDKPPSHLQNDSSGHLTQVRLSTASKSQANNQSKNNQSKRPVKKTSQRQPLFQNTKKSKTYYILYYGLNFEYSINET